MLAFHPSSQNITRQLELRRQGKPINLEGFRHNRFLKNFQEENFSETSLKYNSSSIVSYTVHEMDAQIAILAHNSLKLWDIESKKCLWTYPLDLIKRNKVKLILSKENVILFSSSATTSTPMLEKRILILDRINGTKIAAIQDQRLETDKAYLVGQRIFCVLNNGNIGEWNLSGKPVRILDFEYFSEKFCSAGNFLVNIAGNTVRIYDLSNNTTERIDFRINKSNQKITAIHIDPSYLTLGFSSTGKGNNPDCAVIDLKRKKISSQHQLSDAFAYREPDTFEDQPSCLYESGVKKIIKLKDRIYLWHSTGSVVEVQIDTNKYTSLGLHNAVGYFEINCQRLITASSNATLQTAEINVWDLNSREIITKIIPPGLRIITFKGEKMFASASWNNHYLIMRDYLGANDQ